MSSTPELCKNCGVSVSPEARFCDSCGSPVQPGQEAAPALQDEQPQPAPQPASFQQPAAYQPPSGAYQPVAPKSSNKKTWIIVAIVAAVLVLLGCGAIVCIYMVMNGSGGTNSGYAPLPVSAIASALALL